MYAIDKIFKKKNKFDFRKRLKERGEKNLNNNTFKAIRIYNKSYTEHCFKNFQHNRIRHYFRKNTRSNRHNI